MFLVIRIYIGDNFLVSHNCMFQNYSVHHSASLDVSVCHLSTLLLCFDRSLKIRLCHSAHQWLILCLVPHHPPELSVLCIELRMLIVVSHTPSPFLLLVLLLQSRLQKSVSAQASHTLSIYWEQTRLKRIGTAAVPSLHLSIPNNNAKRWKVLVSSVHPAAPGKEGENEDDFYHLCRPRQQERRRSPSPLAITASLHCLNKTERLPASHRRRISKASSVNGDWIPKWGWWRVRVGRSVRR